MKLPGSPNPDPISDQKMPFSTPVFRPGGGSKCGQRFSYKRLAAISVING